MASSIHSSGTGCTTTSDDSDKIIPDGERDHVEQSSSNENELSQLGLDEDVEEEVENSGPTNIDLVVSKLYLGE